MKESFYDVAIAGGGPAGLTLAIDLGRRGISTLLLEKNPEPGPWPKMERCNARSMEIFRRLGVANQIRNVGFPADASMDVFVLARMDLPPLRHLRYDSVGAFRDRIAATNDGSQPREPYQLVSQYALEPVLKMEAERLAGVDVCFGHELLRFEEDGEGLNLSVRALDGVRSIRARYLAACDGGTSQIRKALGIPLEGEGRLQRLSQVQFRSDDVYDRIPAGRGRHYYMADGRGIVVQGNRKDFTLHSPSPPDTDFTAEIRALFGFDFSFEVLRVNSWNLNLLVAQRYRAGRVFLVGDAAHLVIPMGGLGMNTAVGDATDLAWKLAGTIAGWGGPELLASYEEERRPVGLFNRDASRYATLGLVAWRAAVTDAVYEDGEAGDAAREEIGRLADVYQRRGHEMHGAELGYHYAGSRLTAPTEGASPPWEIDAYIPSTRPGARLPHMWLADGQAMFDLFGAGYVLLNVGPEFDVRPLAAAFDRIGAPLQVVHRAEDQLRRVYTSPLLLLRPDLHVVWRGDVLPEDCAALAALATGWTDIPQTLSGADK